MIFFDNDFCKILILWLKSKIIELIYWFKIKVFAIIFQSFYRPQSAFFF